MIGGTLEVTSVNGSEKGQIQIVRTLVLNKVEKLLLHFLDHTNQEEDYKLINK